MSLTIKPPPLKAIHMEHIEGESAGESDRPLEGQSEDVCFAQSVYRVNHWAFERGWGGDKFASVAGEEGGLEGAVTEGGGKGGGKEGRKNVGKGYCRWMKE